MSKHDEVVDEYLERMKDPSLSKSEFDELEDRLKRLKAIANEA